MQTQKRPRLKKPVEVIKRLDIPNHFFTRKMSRATCCEKLQQGQIIRIPDIFPSDHPYRLCRVKTITKEGVIVEVLSSSFKGEANFLENNIQKILHRLGTILKYQLI